MTFRRELFAAADLPADPDDTWNDFIEAGETYRQHLVEVEAHDADRCLYCRQPLLDPARDLLTRYSTYLEDKISADIRSTDTTLGGYKRQAAGLQGNEMASFIQQYKDAVPSERSTCFAQVEAIESARSAVATAVAAPPGCRARRPFGCLATCRVPTGHEIRSAWQIREPSVTVGGSKGEVKFA